MGSFDGNGATPLSVPVTSLFLAIGRVFLMLVFLFSLLCRSIVALLCILNQPGYSTRITKDPCSHGNSYLGGLVPISHS